ncbi:carotenoid oxygenase family protein [Kitasatospora sp. P5_F3]
MDLATGRVTAERTDDLTVEFPTVNDAFAGREHQYQYALSFLDDLGIGNRALVKYDRTTGIRTLQPFGTGQLPGRIPAMIHGSWDPERRPVTTPARSPQSPSGASGRPVCDTLRGQLTESR